MTIVCLGDSVTRGVREGVEPHQTFCQVLERLLRAAGVNATVINSGIGGHTTADGWGRFEKDVLGHHPRHVVIMFGLNDSYLYEKKNESAISLEEFESNLRRMTDSLKSAGAISILMTANPMYEPTFERKRNATLHPYIEATRRVARESKSPLADVYSRFCELGMEESLQNFLTDGMHPNPKGNEVIARMLFEVLRDPACL